MLEGVPILSLQDFNSSFGGVLHLSTFKHIFVKEVKDLYEERRNKDGSYNGHHLEISESELKSILLNHKLNENLSDKL